MAVIVFDNDDTLMMNEWQYSEAYARCFACLYKIFQDFTPNFHSVNDRFFAIDKGLRGEWGVKRGRIAKAMELFYGELCIYAEARGLKFSRKAQEKHLRSIAEIGDLPFDYTKMCWRRGVEKVLKQLKDEGNTLCLLTCYDQDVFPKKAEFLRIHRFFEPRHILAIPKSKTKEDFIAVSGWSAEEEERLGREYIDRTWFAVGNGESDIKPALEISPRWRGIYLPHGSTSPIFEQGKEANDWPKPASHFMPQRFVHDRVTTVMELDSRRAFEEVRNIVNNADEYV